MSRPCSIFPDQTTLWDPPREGSLQIRGELNREDIEGRKRRTEDGGKEILSSDLILHSSDLPTCAPGRLDRVLESLE